MLLKLSADHPTIPLEVLLCWANMARNSLQMWNGFSFYQLVFGINPNVPNVMTDKLPGLDARTSTQIFNDHLNALDAARRAFVQSESEERIRRALRTKVWASEESYVFGDKVFYKKDSSEKWLGPVKVMFQDGRIVFLRHGAVVVRVSPNRLVKAHQGAEDESDIHKEVPSNHKSEDKMSSDKSAAAASDSDSYSEKSVHEDGIESYLKKPLKKTTHQTKTLTHWGRDKMAAIFQTTFSNAFSSMKMCKFRLVFDWNVFPRVQLTIFQHWFR